MITDPSLGPRVRKRSRRVVEVVCSGRASYSDSNKLSVCLSIIYVSVYVSLYVYIYIYVYVVCMYICVSTCIGVYVRIDVFCTSVSQTRARRPNTALFFGLASLGFGRRSLRQEVTASKLLVLGRETGGVTAQLQLLIRELGKKQGPYFRALIIRITPQKEPSNFVETAI